MELIQEILAEIQGVLHKIDEKQMQEFVARFDTNKRIFIDGEGRSGLQAKGFAMRLMHLGYTIYVVGETITPALRADDIFVAISGSGTSANVIADTQKASNIGAQILVVTSKPESTLGKMAERVLVISGTVKGDVGDKRKSIQLLSSLFDQSLHVALDTVCLLLSRRDAMSNDTATSTHW